MSEDRRAFRQMLDPYSLFFVPEGDLRSRIAWADREMDRLQAELKDASAPRRVRDELAQLREDLRQAREDRKDLREEIARLRSVATQRSDDVRRLTSQLRRKAT